MGKMDTDNYGYARCGLRRSRSSSGLCGLCGGLLSRGSEGSCRCAHCTARNEHNGQTPGCGGSDMPPARPSCSCGEQVRERDAGGGNRRCNNGNCGELMNRLQKVDFSIQETVLYLDAYPDCCQARQYYHQLIDERRRLAAEYEKTCGPLNTMGNESTTSWDWTVGPWPWHPDFPGNARG